MDIYTVRFLVPMEVRVRINSTETEEEGAALALKAFREHDYEGTPVPAAWPNNDSMLYPMVAEFYAER
jgi:hypothetical protein